MCWTICRYRVCFNVWYIYSKYLSLKMLSPYGEIHKGQQMSQNITVLHMVSCVLLYHLDQISSLFFRFRQCEVASHSIFSSLQCWFLLKNIPGFIKAYLDNSKSWATRDIRCWEKSMEYRNLLRQGDNIVTWKSLVLKHDRWIIRLAFSMNINKKTIPLFGCKAPSQ